MGKLILGIFYDASAPLQNQECATKFTSSEDDCSSYRPPDAPRPSIKRTLPRGSYRPD
jgi:hypothetical protein